MTYITAYLPSKEELKKELEKYPENIKTYIKYMGFEGPEGSIDYLTEQIEKYLESIKDKK
jgi:hypothetical protein